MKSYVFFLFVIAPSMSYSLTWNDLWFTKNQQAQYWMNRGEFEKAEQEFQDQEWRATAAYKANHYKDAVEYFKSLKNERAYYNQGNALAKLGHYQEAIDAYDKALSFNSKNEDAQYNRNLVAALLKQQKEARNDKGHDNNTSKSNDARGSEPQDSNSKPEPKEELSQKNSNTNESKSNSLESQSLENENQKKEKDLPQKGDLRAEEQSSTEGNKQKSDMSDENEQQQAKEQWLRLIPDDPGGLLREKFLRDYKRRQLGSIP